jgi:hypothetical protein
VGLAQKKSLDVRLCKSLRYTLPGAYAGGKLKIRFQGRMQRGDNHEEERLLLCERIIRKAKVLTEKRHTMRNVLLPSVRKSLTSFYLTGKVLI